MKLINILIVIFLLTAFTLGVSMRENNVDITLLDKSINNVSESITNISLTYPIPETESTIPNIQGFYLVLEKYIHFIGILGLEVMRAGIDFGFNNPEYFEANYLLNIVKLIIILIIISLLIQPLTYFLVFSILLIIWIRDKLKDRKEKRLKLTLSTGREE